MYLIEVDLGLEVFLSFFGEKFEFLPGVILDWEELFVVEADVDVGDAGFEDFVLWECSWLILDDVMKKLYTSFDVLLIVDFFDFFYLLVEFIQQCCELGDLFVFLGLV